MQVVKSHQQVLSNLNDFMVTEFRTLFTNKHIDLAATFMPLVREFNQVCQVFADNVSQRYGYDLEPQALTPEELKSWAKQFRVPVTWASLDTSDLQLARNGNQGAITQLAGLFPSQQAKVQPQVGFFLTEQKQPADNYANRQESGNHTPDDQVRAGMYKSGHTIDPVREELIHLQGVADNWEQQHPNSKQTKCCQYLETHPRPGKEHKE